jgi:hypothetical protein
VYCGLSARLDKALTCSGWSSWPSDYVFGGCAEGRQYRTAAGLERMRLWKTVLGGGALVAGGAAAAGLWSYRSAMEESREAWERIASAARPDDAVYSPAMVAGQPEIAQRYFNHAIAPGTPLGNIVELDMRGTFLLGDRSSYQSYAMEARQVLHPPSEFVWIPHMRSGMMRISGFDALVSGSAWTRFWLAGLVPVANARSSPDLVRSATFRSTMESIWVPASLLPRNRVVWEQAGPDRARVRVQRVAPEIVLEMTLTPSGAVREIVGQRWSNANPQGAFRLQPFGGTIEAEYTFGGYTIPSRIKAGNHYGTSDYLPFFQAELTDARYH